MKKVTWFKTATRRLEERLAQFFGGPVIVTEGGGFVGVVTEPDPPRLALGVESDEFGLGRFLAVDDLIAIVGYFRV